MTNDDFFGGQNSLQNTRIKVLNIITDSNFGGVGRYILTFLRYYNREEFEVIVVLPKKSQLLPEIEKLGVRAIGMDRIFDKSFDISAIRQMSALFKKEQPDIVHTHACLSARIAARISFVLAFSQIPRVKSEKTSAFCSFIALLTTGRNGPLVPQ